MRRSLTGFWRAFRDGLPAFLGVVAMVVLGNWWAAGWALLCGVWMVLAARVGRTADDCLALVVKWHRIADGWQSLYRECEEER